VLFGHIHLRQVNAPCLNSS